MKSFELQMQEWAKKTGLKTDKVVEIACIKLSTEIMKRTPVDSGRLVGNWIPSINTPQLNEIEKNSPDYVGVVNNANKASGKTFWLVNNLPYVRRIEYEGWSKVKAPQGMVRVSIQSFRTFLEEATR